VSLQICLSGVKVSATTEGSGTVLALRGGRVLTADGWSDDDLLLEGSEVCAGGSPDEVLDVTGCVVAPGFVDLHVHGAGGHPAQGAHADLAAMAAALTGGGVTSFLATAFAAPLDELRSLVVGARPTSGARCLGVHLEGPWLSPGAAGAQPADALRLPDLAEARALLDGGDVRIVTLAPELDGAPELLAALVERGIRVSLGHSRASYDDAARALVAGATGVTHCFNAMSQLDARDPGLVGAALSWPGIVVEVIADGVHVHPAGVLALHAARGAEGVALVSDCVDGCGPADLVRDGEVLRLPDGTLAGSAAALVDAVRHVVGWGVPLEDALAMASTTPARALGLDVALRPGARADVVVLDAGLRVRDVLVGGVRQ
jgi:N-acetylglucosamine-6-phosphate deacetylase